MRKHPVNVHTPRRLAAWKRNLIAAVAVATMAPAAVMASTGFASAGTAYADPTYRGNDACPADGPSLVEAAVKAYNDDPIGFTNTDIVNNPHSLYSTVRSMGVDSLYNQGYFGYDAKAGKPVDIALIDTGVSPVKGLDNGNVVHGPDLSFDSQSPDLAHLDGYGHGTHLSSIMVGRDNANASNAQANGPYSWRDPKSFTGIAPGARVVSVRAGDASGASDVTQIIAAVDWAVKHAHDAGLNIRVINLSYGLNSPLKVNYKNDALSYAIEQAYNAGIVVVAAAGNDGAAKARKDAPIAKMGVAGPAFNPSIIAVGANDPATPWQAPAFSQSMSEANRRAVDFTAPGVSILGLHDPGSFQDDDVIAACKKALGQNEDGKAAPQESWTQPIVGPGARFIAGSGTSQAAAVVSGVVAVLLSRPMSATPTPSTPQSPDWVKAVLKRSAAPSLTIPDSVEGQGAICARCAANTFPTVVTQTTGSAVGGADLDATRGPLDGEDFLWDGAMTPQVALMPGACTPGNYFFINLPWTCQQPKKAYLSGNIDIFGHMIDPATLAAREAVNPKTGGYVNKAGGPWVSSANGTESWNGGFTQRLGISNDSVLGAPAVAGSPWAANTSTAKSWSRAGWRDESWSRAGWRDGAWERAGWRDADWVRSGWREDGWIRAGWRDSDWADFGWM